LPGSGFDFLPVLEGDADVILSDLCLLGQEVDRVGLRLYSVTTIVVFQDKNEI